jgi:lactoylglutathione lyase
MAEMTARLDHVGLAVADLGAAAAWYCDVFGLVPELSLRVDAIDLSIEMLIHPAFGYRVELLHRPGTSAGVSGQPANPAEAALRAGYGHVAFAVADLDAAYDHAVARGAAGHAAVPGAGTRGADGLRRRSRGQPRRASG